MMRLVLATLGMRVDDPHNGCWLPKDWPDRPHMPNYLRKAVPHRRIHTQKYYEWLTGRINIATTKTPGQLIHALRFSRNCLQNGAIPPAVMPQTGK